MNFEHPAVRNGVFGGFAAVILGLLFYLVDTRKFLSLSGFLMISLYIIAMVRAARERKGDVDYFSFLEAFKTSFLTYVIATLVYVIFHFVLMNFVDPGLADLQKEISIETLEKMSGFMGEDQLDAALAAIEAQDMKFTAGRALTTFAWGLIFPGCIIALIVAAFTKHPKPTEYS